MTQSFSKILGLLTLQNTKGKTYTGSTNRQPLPPSPLSPTPPPQPTPKKKKRSPPSSQLTFRYVGEISNQLLTISRSYIKDGSRFSYKSKDGGLFGGVFFSHRKYFLIQYHNCHEIFIISGQIRFAWLVGLGKFCWRVTWRQKKTG